MEKKTPLDPATRREVIEGLLSNIRENYVFPTVAEAIDAAIHQRLQGGEYETITTAEIFAHQLTSHLQEINIGYLDVRAFYPPEFAGDVAIAAMNFLANTSVLIIDLRKNDGGEPAMVALICSYFFDAEPVHLNSFYWRTSDSTQQVWTLPYVPGKRYLGKPVYLLTSRDTVSGAEEFAYTLKNMKRATVIGEVTGGAAHPGEVYKIHPHFGAFIPTGRPISPITGTDWEGTGVIPDIEIPQDQALKAAQVLALKQLLETSGANEARDQRWFVKEATDALAELEQK